VNEGLGRVLICSSPWRTFCSPQNSLSPRIRSSGGLQTEEEEDWQELEIDDGSGGGGYRALAVNDNLSRLIRLGFMWIW